MNFWDSSAVIEAHDSTSKVQGLLDNLLRQRTRHAASRLLQPEVISALARRNRQDTARSEVVLRHAIEALDGFQFYSVTDEVIARSIEMAREGTLKGADAVHLSTALILARDAGRRGFVFITLDKALAIAARKRGFRVIGA